MSLVYPSAIRAATFGPLGVPLASPYAGTLANPVIAASAACGLGETIVPSPLVLSVPTFPFDNSYQAVANRAAAGLAMAGVPVAPFTPPVVAYPARQVVAHPARQVVAHPARQVVAHPARQVVAHPARQVVAHPARQVVAHPARQVVAHPARQVVAHPARRVVASPARRVAARPRAVPYAGNVATRSVHRGARRVRRR